MSPLRSILTDLWRVGSRPLRSLQMRRMKSTGRVPVFVLFYHRVADTHPNPWSMDFATFTRQINWMRERFDLISMAQVQQRISSGFNDRPAISITFDDGYSENCEEALPFLISSGIPVTYFVTTEHVCEQIPFPHDVQRGAPLPANTIESLRALAKAGIEIGAHSRSHLDLGSARDPQLIFDEVISATRELETLIDQKIRYFAFPYGQYENLQASVFHLLRQHGIEGVCSAYGGWNEIGGDAFHIQRIHGDPDFSRMRNWLSYDPRFAAVERYDYAVSDIDSQRWLLENGKTDSPSTTLDPGAKEVVPAPDRKVASAKDCQ